MIYLVIFFISAFFAYMYEKVKNKYIKKVYAALAILLPCLLAAFRKTGIGTDTLYYISDVFYKSLSYDNLFKFIQVTNVEAAYLLINFIVSRITQNIQILYFVLQFIIQFFIFKSCDRMKKHVPVYFSYLTFLLLYYNRSLNMCRQTIALSIILYSYQYLKDKSYLKGGILLLIATLFHKSAIFGIFIYAFTFIFNNYNYKRNTLLKIFIYFLMIILVISYNNILIFLIRNGIINSRYIYYLANYKGNIILIDYMLKLAIIILLTFLYKYLAKDANNKNLYYFLIIEFTLYHLGFVANYAQRISYYFGYFNIFMIPQIPKCFQGNKVKFFVKAIIILVLIIYWYLYYGYLGADATMPYISIFSS